jgi:hypothetical protein
MHPGIFNTKHVVTFLDMSVTTESHQLPPNHGHFFQIRSSELVHLVVLLRAISIQAELFQTSTLKMKAASFSEKSLSTYKSTRTHNPEENNQKTRRHENLEAYATFFH